MEKPKHRLPYGTVMEIPAVDPLPEDFTEEQFFEWYKATMTWEIYRYLLSGEVVEFDPR